MTSPCCPTTRCLTCCARSHRPTRLKLRRRRLRRSRVVARRRPRRAVFALRRRAFVLRHRAFALSRRAFVPSRRAFAQRFLRQRMSLRPITKMTHHPRVFGCASRSIHWPPAVRCSGPSCSSDDLRPALSNPRAAGACVAEFPVRRPSRASALAASLRRSGVRSTHRLESDHDSVGVDLVFPHVREGDAVA